MTKAVDLYLLCSEISGLEITIGADGFEFYYENLRLRCTAKQLESRIAVITKLYQYEATFE